MTNDALTASELRVARLAAVSLKTVETHLSHVYRKLGLSGQGSRGAAPGGTRPPGGGG